MAGETAYQRQGRLQRERQAARAERMAKSHKAEQQKIKRQNRWARMKPTPETSDFDYSMNG